MQEDVLATAEAELEDVFFFELVVALGFYSLVVQEGAVARAQVDDVRLDPASSGPVCTCNLHQPAHKENSEIRPKALIC